jgi:hypothetical protein
MNPTYCRWMNRNLKQLKKEKMSDLFKARFLPQILSKSAVHETRLAGHPCHITTLSNCVLNSVKWCDCCKIWLDYDNDVAYCMAIPQNVRKVMNEP